MSDYISKISELSSPTIYKRELLSGGEVSLTKVFPFSLEYEEFLEIPEELVQTHMSDLTLYIQELAKSLEIIDPESPSSEGWPLKGWTRIQEANNELVEWWSSFQYRKIREKEKAEAEALEQANLSEEEEEEDDDVSSA